MGRCRGTEHRLVRIDSPYRGFPNFYGHGHTPDHYKDIQIGGSTSLLNLTDKTMKSHYGYFGDDPITLSLLPYVS